MLYWKSVLVLFIAFGYSNQLDNGLSFCGTDHGLSQEEFGQVLLEYQENIKVKLKNKSLGNIEEWFIQKLKKGDTFIFGGETLRFESLKYDIVNVNKSKNTSPRIQSYTGGKMPLSAKLAERVISIIIERLKSLVYLDRIMLTKATTSRILTSPSLFISAPSNSTVEGPNI